MCTLAYLCRMLGSEAELQPVAALFCPCNALQASEPHLRGGGGGGGDCSVPRLDQALAGARFCLRDLLPAAGTGALSLGWKVLPPQTPSCPSGSDH